MSWRESVKGPAKFRDVPFFVATAERAGGRRGVTHEYPLRDEPFREDLGRKVRTFTVEGYVLGEDYLTARDRLIEALEKVGPGELIHPYYGARRVAVLSFRVRESSQRGGIAEFSIEFEETPAKPVQPSIGVDAASAVRSSAVAAKSSVVSEFLAKYSPGSLLGSVSDQLRKATLAVDKVLSKVSTEQQKLATMKGRITRLQASVASLVRSPEALVAGLVDLLDGLAPPTALLALYSFAPGDRPPATTPRRVAEQTSFDAMQRFIQRVAVINAATLSLDEIFPRYDDAIARRSAITDLIEEQAEIAADDTYPTLLQLRADLIKAIPGEGRSLPRLLSHSTSYTIPSLVLAHQLYGDVSRESDIVDRNRIGKPGFILGGTVLEVLSRA